MMAVINSSLMPKYELAGPGRLLPVVRVLPRIREPGGESLQAEDACPEHGEIP